MAIFGNQKTPFPPAPNSPVKQERKAGSARYTPTNAKKRKI